MTPQTKIVTWSAFHLRGAKPECLTSLDQLACPFQHLDNADFLARFLII